MVADVVGRETADGGAMAFSCGPCNGSTRYSIVRNLASSGAFGLLTLLNTRVYVNCARQQTEGSLNVLYPPLGHVVAKLPLLLDYIVHTWMRMIFCPRIASGERWRDSRWQRVEKTRKSADTEPVGRGFGSGFVPAGAGTNSNPTGIC